LQINSLSLDLGTLTLARPSSHASGFCLNACQLLQLAFGVLVTTEVSCF